MPYVKLSEDNVVIEISPVPDTEDILTYYVAGIAEQFIKVDAPEEMTFGWKFQNGEWISPPPPPPFVPPESEQPSA